VAAIVDTQWNEINKYGLDVRRPDVYRVQHSNPEEALQQWVLQGGTAGPDFISLIKDDEFLQALHTKSFSSRSLMKHFRSQEKL